MAWKWVKWEDIPWILQELSDKEKESNNAEIFYENDRDLTEENIEVNWFWEKYIWGQ